MNQLKEENPEVYAEAEKRTKVMESPYQRQNKIMNDLSL
jgi:hypothetical protein